MKGGEGWPPLHAGIDGRNILVTLKFVHNVCLENKLYGPKDSTIRQKRIRFMTEFSFFRNF